MMLKIASLIKRYPEQEKMIDVLNGLDFEIEKGRQVCIIGPSGSGKSTLLNIIGGLETADAGEVFVNGKNILDLSESKKAVYRRENVGFIFQNYSLLEDFNVLENLLLAGRLKKISEAVLKKRAEEILESLGLKNKKESKIGDLSGGEAQRVAIARARINKPNLVLADEATGNIDEATSKKLLKEMLEHNRLHGVTMLFVTHNLQLIPYFDECYKIEYGKIKKEEKTLH